jgi:hypothetical protein
MRGAGTQTIEAYRLTEGDTVAWRGSWWTIEKIKRNGDAPAHRKVWLSFGSNGEICGNSVDLADAPIINAIPNDTYNIGDRHAWVLYLRPRHAPEEEPTEALIDLQGTVRIVEAW